MIFQSFLGTILTILPVVLSILGVYTLVLLIQALKIYINNNS